MLNYISSNFMKKRILPLIALLILMIGAEKSQAQDSVKVDPSLNGQYRQLLSQSKNFYGSKVITPQRLGTFWKNISDTLRTERKQLRTSKASIAAQQKTITELKNQIAGKETALSTSNQKLNEITFMGISFEKSTYNTIVWSAIVVLALALAFVIIRSAKHIHEAKYRSGLYEEIATEYQSYKVKANEKEKKLARELQDERNKLEEYKSRGK
jgi:uncharacterized coiled-coil protein SlyX